MKLTSVIVKNLKRATRVAKVPDTEKVHGKEGKNTYVTDPTQVRVDRARGNVDKKRTFGSRSGRVTSGSALTAPQGSLKKGESQHPIFAYLFLRQALGGRCRASHARNRNVEQHGCECVPFAPK